MKKRIQKTLIATAIASIALSGCSSSEDSNSNTPNTSQGSDQLLGSVMKGPIDNATVIIKIKMVRKLPAPPLNPAPFKSLTLNLQAITTPLKLKAVPIQMKPLEEMSI